MLALTLQRGSAGADLLRQVLRNVRVRLAQRGGLNTL